MKHGMVYDIQRFSLHDGPGIRTLVFLKGCPLRCLWCSNPESQNISEELLYIPSRCIHCDLCYAVCKYSAIKKENYTKDRIIRELCTLCGDCARECPTTALSIKGKKMSVDEVLNEIIKDKKFYESSNGGVTISGGEPFFQPEFTHELLKCFYENGINTAVETSGDTPWESIEYSLPYINLFLFDIKAVNPEKHIKLTKRPNHRILENLKNLVKEGLPFLLRIPIVPGLNDTENDIKELLNLFKDLKITSVELLEYHELGVSKYEYLNRIYEVDTVSVQDAHKRIVELVELFKENGISTIYDKLI